MCGICGFTNFSHKIDSPEKIIGTMKSVLRHRGPDQDGTFMSNNIILGHTRLSIIDLEAGNQPISNEDGSVWITFNGEIYNYRDLKNDLILRHKFTTNTDTEVIVHLYEEFGNNCVDKLDGMFSFCIWDSKREKLFCARDRFGKKPFYYTTFKGEFIFSSELKGILQYPGLNQQIDPGSLSRYLAYEYIPSPRTIFKEVYKLPAAHYLIFEKKRVRIEKYWELTSKETKELVFNEYIENIEFLLQKAVKKRLMSDVPLGVFLSGGIDSSSVAYFMSKAVSAHSKIKSFSVGFKESSFDESFFADNVANFLGTEHYSNILSPKVMLEILPKIVEKIDEPFADASIVPTYFLSSFAKEHISVALTGDGGDELFCGYDTFLASKISFFYDNIPKIIDKLIIRNIVKRMPVSMSNFSFDFKLKQFLKGMDYNHNFRNQVWLGAFSPDQQKLLFNDQANLFLSDQEIYKDILDYKTINRTPNEISEIMHFYIKFYLQEDILTKIDRASMMNSLEVRSPFLDVDLFEFVNSIPVHLKLKGFTTKYILRRMLHKKLPRDVINRKKKGFNIPIAEWFRGPLKPLLLEVLSEKQLKKHGFFKYSYVKQIIQEHLSGKVDNRKQLWTLFMFELWFNKWVQNE